MGGGEWLSHLTSRQLQHLPIKFKMALERAAKYDCARRTRIGCTAVTARPSHTRYLSDLDRPSSTSNGRVDSARRETSSWPELKSGGPADMQSNDGQMQNLRDGGEGVSRRLLVSSGHSNKPHGRL